MSDDRSALDLLSQTFQNESAASMLLERLDAQNLTVDPKLIQPLSPGYTAARLVSVMVCRLTGAPRPQRWVLKLCPPGPFGRAKENRAHRAAFDDDGTTFPTNHLIDTVFDPVFCDDGWMITGQRYAKGQPLASLSVEHQIKACTVIRAALLKEWTAGRHHIADATLAELVRVELRDSLAAGKWLHEWAQGQGLLDHDTMPVGGQEGSLLNPFQIFGPDSSYSGPTISHLVGRTHGDLHGDNILIPENGGEPIFAEFRLIDLATYQGEAPLTRDIAALMMALVVGRSGDLGSQRVQTALIDYLLKNHRDDALARRIPEETVDIVDVLRAPREDFVCEWDEFWYSQLKVSLLAQAMLHAAYGAGDNGPQAWPLRLAGRLTGLLLGEDAPGSGSPSIAAPQPDRLKAPPTDRPDEESASSIVDRRKHRADLSTALVDDHVSVVAVHGPAGVGKTALVQEVVAGLGWLREDSDRRVCWHEPALPTDVSIQTLIADLEGGLGAGVRHLYGTRSLARLEIALDAHRDDVPVIVIDAAENLLDDIGRVGDIELDLAFESITSRKRRVKVVLVSSRPIEARAEVTWPSAIRSLDMSGLEPRHLVDYLRRLDARGAVPRLPAEDEVLLRMHEGLVGNPRMAELFHALVAWDKAASLDDLAGWLTSLPRNEVRQRVVHRLADRLPEAERLTLEALAAFAIPMPVAAVEAVVNPELSPDRCREAVRTLVESRIVRRRRDGRLQIPTADLNPILHRIDHGDRYAELGEHLASLDLLHRAANEFHHHQKAYADVHTVGDLDMHFADLGCILRARMYEIAHELIEQIDDEVLRPWGSSALLRQEREAVRDHLGDREAAMSNLAALGGIYSSVGDRPAADRAFEEALAIARGLDDRGAIRGVYVNMGVRYWDHDEITSALTSFNMALALAEVDDDDADRALALEGIADCHQQMGSYAEAFDKAERAFAVAQNSSSERVVDLALKLARWRAECGDLAGANSRLADADMATDESRRAEYLNGRADLLLYGGRHLVAAPDAELAVRLAGEGCDPEALPQALTTLALAHLYCNEVDEAARQISRAMRYRPRDSHLDTLALRGIVAFRLGQPATAADFFSRLAHEAKARIHSCDADSWAWDFLGLTRCFDVARGRTDELQPAVAAFRRVAAAATMPTRGRNSRIAFLVGQLAVAAERRADLLPVLDDLAVNRPGLTNRPSGPGR